MKKIIVLINLLLLVSFVHGNNIKEHLGDGYFYVKGKISNFPKSQNNGKIQILAEGYIEQSLVEAIINKDGSFEIEIPITDVQDVSFFVEQTQISFFSYKNDTIKIEFRHDRPLETMKLTGTSESRNRDLALCLALSKYGASNPRSVLINMMMDPSFSDLTRKEKLNQYYKEQIEIINEFLTEKDNIARFKNKLINDVYYQTCQIALYGGTKFLPLVNNGFSNAQSFYNSLNYDIFRTSAVYRNYLSRYFFMNSIPPYSYAVLKDEEENGTEISSLKREYYYALSQIKMTYIRDWFITTRLLLLFPESEPEDIKFVLDDFETICQNDSYITNLKELYIDILNLYNAAYAPDFELKNENGESVLLSDFKGNIVYLDFWNPYCAPCINEFKNYDKKFHEKYEDHEIVHMYICFSNDKAKWKADIKKYDLQGINLIVNSDKENILHKNYSFSAFPHYILINSAGKIYKNGCESPSEILSSKENSLDKLLKIDN